MGRNPGTPIGTKAQLLMALEEQGEDNKNLASQLNTVMEDITRLSTERTRLIQEVKDLEEELLEQEERYEKALQALEEEHEKRKQYLEGVGSGLSHAISVIVSGVTVPVD